MGRETPLPPTPQNCEARFVTVDGHTYWRAHVPLIVNTLVPLDDPRFPVPVPVRQDASAVAEVAWSKEAYGILLDDLPIILANSLGFLFVLSVLVAKLKYG